MFYTSFLIDKMPEKTSYLNFTKKEIDCLVFRTSINSEAEVLRISETLNTFNGILKWSVDLDNWEKILRIECKNVSSATILSLLASKKIIASELPV